LGKKCLFFTLSKKYKDLPTIWAHLFWCYYMKIDAIYEQLRHEIDTRMPLGFPETADKKAARMLAMLFTPEEARVAVHLSILGEPIEKIHKRVKKVGISISQEDLKVMLEGLLTKGAISGTPEGTKPGAYGLSQFVIGFFEAQVDHLTPEFVDLAEEYGKEEFYKEFFHPGRPQQLRTIPIEQSLTSKYYVATFDRLSEILEKAKDPIVLLNCVCKQAKDLQSQPCKLGDMRETCICTGNFAQTVLDLGIPSARQVQKDEVSALFDQWQAAGYVVQPENAQEPEIICMCCGCCCGVLTLLKQFPRPSDFVTSNYFAEVSIDRCNGCGRCVNRCQMEAISIAEQRSQVNLGRCIGCGNCVVTCARGAIELHPKTKQKRPPKTRMALLQSILLMKRGTWGSLKLLGNMILHRKM
jgi:ferredoxin